MAKATTRETATAIINLHGLFADSTMGEIRAAMKESGIVEDSSLNSQWTKVASMIVKIVVNP